MVEGLPAIMCFQTVREMFISGARRMGSGNSVRIDNGPLSPIPLQFQGIWTDSNRCATGVRSGHKISREPKVIRLRHPVLLMVEVDHQAAAADVREAVEEEINSFFQKANLL